MIDNNRWNLAQKTEFDWWSNDFLLGQLEEIKLKYSKTFSDIENYIKITDDHKILDVGCGATCISLLFSKGKKYGIDSLMDEYKAHLNIPEGIELSTGVGEDIQFEDNFFDIVTCRNALDHTKNPEKVIDEISRVLKPNGHIIFAVNVCSHFAKKAHKFVENKGIFLREEQHPHYFTIRDVHRMLNKHFIITGSHTIKRVPTSIKIKEEDTKFYKNGISYLLNLKFGTVYEKIMKFHIYQKFWNFMYWINKNIHCEEWFEEEYFVVGFKYES
jgi:ubiquinone/menaquinone biosynthesis C-methylase UbiE